MPLTSVQNPADLANVSLARLGFKLRVGSLLDGSDHANSILDVYGETRDEMLRNFDYDFAQRMTVLTLLKSAPVNGYFPPTVWNPAINPPMDYSFEYAFPDDALKIRMLKPAQLFPVNMDPGPNPFGEYNDSNYVPARRTIISNLANAVAVYTGRVTDPTTWDVAFTGAFAAELAKRVGPSLVPLQNVQIQDAPAAATLGYSQMEGR